MTVWKELTVAVVQAGSGLDPAANTARLDQLTPSGVQLVVFPEVFQRDFGPTSTDLAAVAEPVGGPFGSEVERVAAERRCHLVAGMMEQSSDRPFNTLLVASPRGLVASYRKIHLYDSFGYRESDRLSAGTTTPTVVDIDGVPVGLMTCYDLRFPELARELVARGAEVLVVSAAWVAGERKVDHWRTLLRARAIENTVYVVASGQPGPRYSGHSMVVDPYGDVVAEAASGEEVITAQLSRAVLTDARTQNPSLHNRRL